MWRAMTGAIICVCSSVAAASTSTLTKCWTCKQPGSLDKTSTDRSTHADEATTTDTHKIDTVTYVPKDTSTDRYIASVVAGIITIMYVFRKV